MSQVAHEVSYHPHTQRWYRIEHRLSQYYPQRNFGRKWKYFPYPLIQHGRISFPTLEAARLFLDEAWIDLRKGAMVGGTFGALVGLVVVVLFLL